MTRLSPTRTACAPAAPSASTSALVDTPDKPTRTTPSGTERGELGSAFRIDLEGFEIAMIHPDQIGPHRKRAFEIGLVVDLYQRVHPERPRGTQQRVQLRPESPHDQEKRISSLGPRFVNLEGVEDEVLAEGGHACRCRGAQIFQRAFEPVGLGQNGEGGGSPGDVCRAVAAASRSSASIPLDGDARLISAMIETSGPPRARRKPLGASTDAIRCSRASSLTLERVSSITRTGRCEEIVEVAHPATLTSGPREELEQGVSHSFDIAGDARLLEAGLCDGTGAAVEVHARAVGEGRRVEAVRGPHARAEDADGAFAATVVSDRDHRRLDVLIEKELGEPPRSAVVCGLGSQRHEPHGVIGGRNRERTSELEEQADLSPRLEAPRGRGVVRDGHQEFRFRPTRRERDHIRRAHRVRDRNTIEVR